MKNLYLKETIYNKLFCFYQSYLQDQRRQHSDKALGGV